MMGGSGVGGGGPDPLRDLNADAMAITPAVFDSQIEECIPQVHRCIFLPCVFILQYLDAWLLPKPKISSVYLLIYSIPTRNLCHITSCQIATLLASTKVDGPPDTLRRNRWIEQQVIEKCTSNVHLGLKVYWLLRAALGHLEIPTRRGLPQITGERQRAHLMSLLSTGEQLAREGRQSPVCLAPLRARYFTHCTNFVAALVKLSFELKQVSAVRRLTALHQGLDRVRHVE